MAEYATVGDLQSGPEAIARAALGAYGLAADVPLTLLNVSENASFRVRDPSAGTSSVLRVHRRGYHGERAIRSELAWVRALRADAGVSAPEVLPASDGDPVVVVHGPAGGQRHVVRFAWLEGVEPAGDRLVEDFRVLGAITARLHLHARRWRPPAWFTRFRWDYDTSIGDRGHWGRWQDGLAVGAAERGVLGRLDALLRRRLAEFGTGPDRFGLVHADMRLANLLVADGPAESGSGAGARGGGGAGAVAGSRAGAGVSVIDFDDCGFGWFLYDFGASLSFIEDDPRVPALMDAWVTGYREVAPLGAAEVGELETFVLLRRLLLVAWISSHRDTDLARRMGADYTRVSCDLAEAYLSRFTRPRPHPPA